MLLSIVVPAYNIEAYLDRCLRSILASAASCLDSNEYEIIVVDDGSTDRSLQIAERYAQEGSPVRTICQSNQGVSAARNNAIRQARGAWCMLVDGDDTITAESLPAITTKIRNTPPPTT